MDECEHDWRYRDDSFSHEFGVEIVKYFECALCGVTRDCETEDFILESD